MPFGEAHYASKLTEEGVKQIKEKLVKPCKCCGHKATLKEIGNQFGVSSALIFKIKHGQLWKHI